MSERVKVLMIEDHPIVRDGCRLIFNRRSDIEVVEASTAEEGFAANREFRPDVIVLDLGLRDGSGFDMIPILFADNQAARILIFSMNETARFVRRALDMGARGYITKNDDPNTILAAIDKVRSGGVYLGQSVAQALALANLEPASDPLRALSGREKQVVALLGEGKSLAEIAAGLDIGYKTVANIVAMIKQKLGIATSVALIKFAVEVNARDRHA
ncbi:MAG TPA: response regulator transcription factor [Methylovirgula sp.]|nr:response regulator transcription factor [Methylovirgula sp.]